MNYGESVKKIPLHLQIVIALVLGAGFGALFPVDSGLIQITYSLDGEVIEENISEWDVLIFHREEHLIKSFSGGNAKAIIKFYNKNKSDITSLSLVAGVQEREILKILSLEGASSPATAIRPLGDLFIRLLSFLAIPLVLASLIAGAASLGDVRKLGKIGGKTFAIYICTTAIAISIGLGVANLIRPGEQISEQTKIKLLGDYQDKSSQDAVANLSVDIVDFFVNIVPKNPFFAVANGQMLQIVFFALMFGVTLTFIPKQQSAPLIAFFEAVTTTMIKMVDIIMLIAPFGVFALISATIADFGFGILGTLFWYSISVIVGLTLQTVLVYGGLIYLFSRANFWKFFKGLRNAQAIAFSTSSSAATLPVTLDCVENKIGVNREVSRFILPLGATINMDGTALYQGVAAVFIAQVYGMDLGLTEQLTIVLTAVLASIGTAPVPGVGLIMLVLILNSINVPAEGIALILGVDRILDMMRTITNVTGDSAVAVAVNGPLTKR